MPTKDVITKRYEKLLADANDGGYTLNPDLEFVRDLTAGLLTNKERYGMEACPCRLVKGSKEDNLDIVCPCVYRDDDLAEYGACFCALYVSPDYDPATAKQVPERRPAPEQRQKPVKPGPADAAPSGLAYPVWRCSVCGYLCANNNPPGKCPVCKVTKERFERFM